MWEDRQILSCVALAQRWRPGDAAARSTIQSGGMIYPRMFLEATDIAALSRQKLGCFFWFSLRCPSHDTLLFVNNKTQLCIHARFQRNSSMVVWSAHGKTFSVRPTSRQCQRHRLRRPTQLFLFRAGCNLRQTPQCHISLITAVCSILPTWPSSICNDIPCLAGLQAHRFETVLEENYRWNTTWRMNMGMMMVVMMMIIIIITTIRIRVYFLIQCLFLSGGHARAPPSSKPAVAGQGLHAAWTWSHCKLQTMGIDSVDCVDRHTDCSNRKLICDQVLFLLLCSGHLPHRLSPVLVSANPRHRCRQGRKSRPTWDREKHGENFPGHTDCRRGWDWQVPSNPEGSVR